ncbi:MAG: serine hydrolase [Candidatus Latescibacteria bacterium]|nr:serine hydrolase [Candidatus Latescibacterota bacterium]
MTNPDTRAAQIDEVLQTYHRHGQFNGSALVAHSGEVICKNGYGLANMEWDLPAQPDTRFRLGSITKQFTAALILQLVAQNRLKLDGKLGEYLPDYRPDTGAQITLHRLLTHTSGIPSYTGLPGFFEEVSRNPYTVDDFVAQYCSGDLEFSPGDQYQYNNSGYFLLGAIIEKITGQTYAENLQQNLLDPLAMDATGYDRHDALIEKRAAGYVATYHGYHNAHYLDMSLPYAAGALYSTVEDLYRWDRALYTEQVLTAPYRDLLFKPQVEIPGGHYAYGWVIRQIELPNSPQPVQMIEHGGGINGFCTLITRLVEDSHLIVLFDNTSGHHLPAINQDLIHILYDQPYALPKQPASILLKQTLEAEGIEATIAQYQTLRQKQTDQYDTSEGDLNHLGYQLLSIDRHKAAARIFALGLEINPESDQAHNGLGETHLAQGDRQQALQCFARALALAPESWNATHNMRKLLKEN